MVILLLSVFAVLGVLFKRLLLDARCWVLAGLLGVSQLTSASDGRLVNLSTRALVETGEEVMIGGFIIEDGARRVLIQARGPELVDFGISNALADPVLTVIQISEGEPPRAILDPPVEIMVNDNWEDSQGQLVTDLWGGSPTLAPGSLSSAAVLTLDPGEYTAKVEGKNGAAGVAIVEVYEIDSTNANGRLVNLSTRALVETGEEVMIGGFIIEDGARQVLIQAKGPELVNEGISNVLADPVLTVTQTSEGEPPRSMLDPPVEIMVNDNWEDSQGQLVTDLWGGSPTLAPGSLSSAAVLTLDPGEYTAKVEGKNGATGVAIVEVYGIDPINTGNPDREALVALYNASDGANWTRSDNWGTDAPLDQWDGVLVDGRGRVVMLLLSENQLSGQIPAELGNLASLEWLWLHRNELRGTIPVELGNLTNLEYLSLRENQLNGPIPVELGNLTNLKSLGLRDNQLSGPIPVELGNLTNLESLSLGDNQLSGPIPVELGNLTNLDFLSLHDNQLSGPIPVELGNLAKLESLSLGDNQLSGPIPVELGNLTNLDFLSLRENQLSGPIPVELGNLAKLESLSLRGNQLNGPIPAELGNLANLESLWLHRNELSGPIPVELGNLTNLENLSLRENQLTGPIPAELGNLTNLEALWLYGNQLSGPIPVELGNLTNLIVLILHTNQLSGPIPRELGNLTNLLFLELQENQLSGRIPAELGNLANLEAILLSDNQFSGCIPSELQDVMENDFSELGLPYCVD